jgi:hypothetical protein
MHLRYLDRYPDILESTSHGCKDSCSHTWVADNTFCEGSIQWDDIKKMSYSATRFLISLIGNTPIFFSMRKLMEIARAIWCASEIASLGVYSLSLSLSGELDDGSVRKYRIAQRVICYASEILDSRLFLLSRWYTWWDSNRKHWIKPRAVLSA